MPFSLLFLLPLISLLPDLFYPWCNVSVYLFWYIFFISFFASVSMYIYPREVLRISSDGDDRRIFLGLKFPIQGFFWVGKFGKYFFVSLI